MLFRSLGGAPRLDLSVVDQNRLTSLSYGVSILAAVVGVALTRRRPRAKVIYVSGLVLTATLIPILSGTERSLGTAATQLYAVAMLLIAYYLVAGVIGGVARRFRGHERMVATALPPAVTATLVLIVTFLATGPSPCVAEQPRAEQPGAEGPPPVVVRIEPPPRPVQVPTDAIVVPYDLAAEDPRASDQIFVPYDRYLELLKAADSEVSDAPPVAYALAGSDYRVRLASGDQLVVEGSLAIDSYSDESLAVPLVMERAMLAEALVDGQPARLRLVLPASDGQAAGDQRPDVNQSAQPASQLWELLLSGRGRRTLSLQLRIPVSRQGGWRSVSARLPHAAANRLTLITTTPDTEIRNRGVSDSEPVLVPAAGDGQQTTLGENGALEIAWRQQVDESCARSGTLGEQPDRVRCRRKRTDSDLEAGPFLSQRTTRPVYDCHPDRIYGRSRDRAQCSRMEPGSETGWISRRSAKPSKASRS